MTRVSLNEPYRSNQFNKMLFSWVFWCFGPVFLLDACFYTCVCAQKGEKGDPGRLGIAGMPGLPGTPVSVTWLQCLNFILNRHEKNASSRLRPLLLQGRPGIDGKRGQSGKDVRDFHLNMKMLFLLRLLSTQLYRVLKCFLFTGREGAKRRWWR